MHPTQLEIMDSLRQGETRKFNELLREVAETSDNLTYHLKQLQKAGFVDSPSKGMYQLAQKGLVYLNNNLELRHDLFPTVSCMLELSNPDGTVLTMKKLKQPYLDTLHLPTFGVTSSATLQAQIDDFLLRYCVEANGLSFAGVYRELTRNDDVYVFDKFFMVFRGAFTAFQADIEDRHFLAMTRAELTASVQTLPATKAVLALSKTGVYLEY